MPWPDSFPSFRTKTRIVSPGRTTGFRALQSWLMFNTRTPWSSATLFRFKSMVTTFADNPDIDEDHLLDPVEDIEPPAAPRPLQGIGGVGDVLQLLKDELRDDVAPLQK